VGTGRGNQNHYERERRRRGLGPQGRQLRRPSSNDGSGSATSTLCCNSLLHPATARLIRDMPELQTRSGSPALLSEICRYLWVVGGGSD